MTACKNDKLAMYREHMQAEEDDDQTMHVVGHLHRGLSHRLLHTHQAH